MNYGLEVWRFFLMTVDPVHIGTGEMSLGRVDNPIVREPGTRIPKIPGTALHGAIRSYAARRFGKPQCAGQGQTEGSKHCGKDKCPICYTFGSVTGDKSFSGVVSICDARILLFPVYSMVGPVWVTSPTVLRDAGLCEEVEVEEAIWEGELSSRGSLNLGWLMVEKSGDDFPQISWPEEIPKQICKRVVIVSDKLFSHVVNSNLEVRTSVAINPETGAVEEGALFTYEAIPRATILWVDVIVDDFRGGFPGKEDWKELFKNAENEVPDQFPEKETEIEKALRKCGYISNRPKEGEDNKEKKKYWEETKTAYSYVRRVLDSMEWKTCIDIVSIGLEWVEYLGVGGMGTRGFGRVKKLCYKEVLPKLSKEAWR